MESNHIGGIVAPTPAVWVSSGRHVVVPFGRVLRVFDVSSGTPSCITCLRGHSASVVAAVSAGVMRVASASKDGTVRVWDVDDGTCLRIIDLGQPVFQICRSVGAKYLVLCEQKVVLLSLDKKEKRKFPRVLESSHFDAKNACIASSLDGSLVAVADRGSLVISSVSEGYNPTVMLSHYTWLSSVAISADGSLLAVGDEKGAIFVYASPKDLFSDSNKKIRLERSQAASSALHWHSSAVGALTFSADGNALISGGHEAVLVTWKMTNTEFGSRTFLPRLRASISSISMSEDESTYAVTQKDNSVRFVDQVGGKVRSVIRGVGGEMPIWDFTPTSNLELILQKTQSQTPQTQLVQIPHCPGRAIIFGNVDHLQLFDMYKGEHLRDISVLPRSSVRDPPPVRFSADHVGCSSVNVVCLNSTGSRMATADEQRFFFTDVEGQFAEESMWTLRIWNTTNFCDKTSLAAVFRQPHGRNIDIASLCFHPSLPILVSSSTSGSIKVWREVVGEGLKRAILWRNEVEFDFKMKPCYSVCFSSDGSLLATGCGSILALWQFEDLLSTLDIPTEGKPPPSADLEPNSPCSVNVNFLHALVHPPVEESIRVVSYIDAQIPIFLACTRNGIYVWNALSQGIWWSTRIRLKPECTAVHTGSGHFALAVLLPSVGAGDEETSHTGDIKHPDTLQIEPTSQSENESDPTSAPGQLNPLSAVDVGRDARSSKQVPKRQRSRRNDRNCDNSGAGTKKKIQNVPCSVDWGVAMFNIMSPVPLWVSRLPSGISVRALEFIPTHEASNDGPPPLGCIDSDFGVSYFGGRDEDATSMVTNPQSTAALHPAGFATHLTPLSRGSYDQLIGDNAGDDAFASTQTTGMELSADDGEGAFPSIRPEITVAFDDFFDGPLHVQAPVSSKSAEFVRVILGNSHESVTDQIREPITQPDANNNLSTKPKDDTAHKRKEVELQLDEFEACRAFCYRIVKSTVRKESKILKAKS